MLECKHIKHPVSQRVDTSGRYKTLLTFGLYFVLVNNYNALYSRVSALGYARMISLFRANHISLDPNHASSLVRVFNLPVHVLVI